MKAQLKQLLAATGLLGPARAARALFRREDTGPVPRTPREQADECASRNGVELVYGPNFISIRRGPHEIRIDVAHEVYALDMINFFEYYFSAVAPSHIDGRLVVDYSGPRVHRLSRSGIEFEFPSLPESDESTEVYLDALALKAGDAVFDLGAYAGASSFFLSRIVGPEGLVAAFEPDETNFRSLLANVERHGLANVKAFKKGVWKETTTLAFQSEGNLGSSAVDVLGRNSNVRMVEVVSLDDAARLAGCGRVAGIKMDIEGAEVAVLRGAGEFLRRHRPSLIVEPHLVDGRMCTEEICEILRSCDYSVNLLSQGVQGWPLVAARPNSPLP